MKIVYVDNSCRIFDICCIVLRVKYKDDNIETRSIFDNAIEIDVYNINAYTFPWTKGVCS